MSFPVVNPATGRMVAERQGHRPADQRRLARAAVMASRRWELTSMEQRSAVLREAATLLRRDAARLAEIMALEMGKPVSQGRAEAEKCAWVCEFYAEHGAA